MIIKNEMREYKDVVVQLAAGNKSKGESYKFKKIRIM